MRFSTDSISSIRSEISIDGPTEAPVGSEQQFTVNGLPSAEVLSEQGVSLLVSVHANGKQVSEQWAESPDEVDPVTVTIQRNDSTRPVISAWVYIVHDDGEEPRKLHVGHDSHFVWPL